MHQEHVLSSRDQAEIKTNQNDMVNNDEVSIDFDVQEEGTIEKINIPTKTFIPHALDSLRVKKDNLISKTNDSSMYKPIEKIILF